LVISSLNRAFSGWYRRGIAAKGEDLRLCFLLLLKVLLLSSIFFSLFDPILPSYRGALIRRRPSVGNLTTFSRFAFPMDSRTFFLFFLDPSLSLFFIPGGVRQWGVPIGQLSAFIIGNIRTGSGPPPDSS